ncbi:Hypothetical predicted protein [Scomber scombrus]|uniref:Uncharacterized protein n=1 Tax=Scomber scombrus TaxID=13677 RepID=A0AAV1P8T1_SCOSC
MLLGSIITSMMMETKTIRFIFRKAYNSLTILCSLSIKIHLQSSGVFMTFSNRALPQGFKSDPTVEVSQLIDLKTIPRYRFRGIAAVHINANTIHEHCIRTYRFRQQHK